MSVTRFWVNPGSYRSFMRGEEVKGSVNVELKEECIVGSLSVQLRGKTSVRWTEAGLLFNTTHHAKEVYFCEEQVLLPATKGKEKHVLSAGPHTFPFSLHFPDQDLPGDFIAFPTPGMTTYTLSACMKRPGLRRNCRDKSFLSYASSVDLTSIVPELMVSGFVPHKARTERNVKTLQLVNEKLEAVPPSTTQTLHQLIRIPHDAYPSVLNCSLLKVEYRIQVIVSPVSMSFKFPIVLLPPLPNEIP
ncbi:unnamed protein product [Merluccius merluccius]